MNDKYSPDSRLFWYLTVIGVVSALIYLLSPILTPFLLAAVIAYICNPLVTWLEARKIPRTLSTIFVMLMTMGIFIAMALILFPLFEKEVSRLVERIPSFLDLVKSQFIPWLEDNFNVELQIDIASLKQMLTEHWKSAGGVAAQMLPSLKSGGLILLTFLMNLVLVPVVLFYLLRDWNNLIRQVGELIPPVWQKQIFTLARETDDVLAEFMRGETAVITIMSIYYVTGLWLVKLEFALPIGLISGILVFVPYLGTITGLALATFAASSLGGGGIRTTAGKHADYPPSGGGAYRPASGSGNFCITRFRPAVWLYRNFAGTAGQRSFARFAPASAHTIYGNDEGMNDRCV